MYLYVVRFAAISGELWFLKEPEIG